MKHATDAMKESRIPAFLASVCALTTVIDLVCFEEFCSLGDKC